MTNFAPSLIAGLSLRTGRRASVSFCRTVATRRSHFGLRFPLQSPLAHRQFIRLSARNCVAGAIDDGRKVRTDAIRDPKHQLHCRVPKSALDQTQHGFGNARTLGDSVLGEFSAFALSLQTPNDLLSDGLVMSNSGHDEGLQQKAFRAYIAMVKYCPGWSRESDLRTNTLLQTFHTIETQPP